MTTAKSQSVQRNGERSCLQRWFRSPTSPAVWIRSAVRFNLCHVVLTPHFLSSRSCRFTRVNKPGQHMFHELYCSGPNTHTAAARLLSLRQTQVRDAIKLLSGVWDVAALSGGMMPSLCVLTCHIGLLNYTKRRNILFWSKVSHNLRVFLTTI